MKILLTILLLIIAQFAFGQRSKSDSISIQINLDKFMNREFFAFTTNRNIISLETKFGMALNSLSKCLMIFSNVKIDANETKDLTLRIEEIATKFFDEGTPIYLSVGGSQSVEWTLKQNKKDHNGNLTFVSLGNYCVVNEAETEFETIFNKKTMVLLGIEKVE